jgi:methionyl-tRNA synthetase
MKTFYITTPIYYANSLPHLGHLYTTIVADVLIKHKKQRGFDTYFLTGTDEHGVNIQRVAEKNGKTPKQHVDFISGEMKKMFAQFGLDNYDIFMRTTEPFHYEAVQNLWREIAGNRTPKGNETIYKGFYEGWFCPNCAEFKTESEYLSKFSPEYNFEIENLLDFIKNSRIFNNEAKELLSEKVIKLKKGENQLNLNAEDFSKLASQLPKRVVNNFNRYFEKNTIAPFFEILEDIKNSLTENPGLFSVNQINNIIKTFREAFDRQLFWVKVCLIHEKPLELVKEESYFFRMTDYRETLLQIIEENPNRLRPEARRNEVVAFIKQGLQDLSISREKKSVSWGIPVPDDENHVMYVWLDALSNYITAIGYGNEERKSVGFEKYWQNVTHLVGKDILRFHTVYWWSFLLAAGIKLPDTVYAHGMWLDAEGRKMGKTLGNAIGLDTLHKHFSIDAIRYFVLREMVFGQDGKFSYENLIDRANADLASGLGNLSSRTLSMITKYREGSIPGGKIDEENYIFARRAGINPDEQDLVSVLEHARDEFIRKLDNYELNQALETVWSVIARIDKMISDAKPWELVKDANQTETLNAVLYRATETLRWLCVLLYPVMPEATRKIFAQIGLSETIEHLNPENLTWGELQAGMRIGETQAVFPRMDKNKIMSEIEKEKESSFVISPLSVEKKEEQPATGEGQRTKDEGQSSEDQFITIDDFLKVELRVGEIKVAERVPNADKLLRFEIDLGEDGLRQILAGLAEYYEPEKLIGRKVVVVANLKPRKMRGLESQGMICAASLSEDDTPALATFLETVRNGARLK